jgi:glycosyltransferase involved in cell wall biosynthesis
MGWPHFCGPTPTPYELAVGDAYGIHAAYLAKCAETHYLGGYPIGAGDYPWPDDDLPARPLRVIHIGPNLLRGGAEQWLIDLLRFLHPGRVRVVRTIVTKADHIDPAYVADLRIPVELGGAESARKAAAECDVILTWGVPLNELLAGSKPPLCVMAAHGEGDWTRWLLEGSDRVVDHVVAVSRAVQERVCRGFPSSVIYNGVDAARLAQTRSRNEVRTQLGFTPEDIVVGYVGRFSPEKRVPIIVEALAGAPRHFKALLVGWGRQRPYLMEHANRSIPGRYAFVTAHDYLGDYYQAMDALCLVSDQEGFPLVMLEAMLCGVPLIVTSVGCVPEVITDRVNGIVVKGDPASVREALHLVEQHPRWARALGAEGKAYADQHGHARRMAREYERLLLGLYRTRFGAKAI